MSQRLLLGIGIVSLLFWITIAALTVHEDIEEVNELYDVHLAHTALALLRVVDVNDSHSLNDSPKVTSTTIERLFSQWPELPDRGVDATPQPNGKPQTSRNVLHGKSLRFQAFHKDGSVLFQTENATASGSPVKLGFSDTTDESGHKWHHYSMWNRQHEVRVVVSESNDLRNQLVLSLASRAVTPLAIGLPVLILFLWLAVKKGLRPVSDLSREIAARKPDDLVPLGTAGVPDEVRPIVYALNGLLQEMTQTMENERCFTDNAAHELRTPLAAIQAQLYALRCAEGDDERHSAMNQLDSSVRRSICLVGQLLTLARLGPHQDLAESRALDLGEVTQNVCAELAPIALKNHQTLELAMDSELPPLNGNADLLAMLLCNLIDNAIRYTGFGGRIDVAVRRGYLGVQVEVMDNGPGIPKDQHKRIFERFYRLASQDQAGTGLGLAICRRIAELHFATVSLSEGLDGRGLVVRVDFPV